MSGGHYNYAFRHVEEFAEYLEIKSMVPDEYIDPYVDYDIPGQVPIISLRWLPPCAPSNGTTVGMGPNTRRSSFWSAYPNETSPLLPRLAPGREGQGITHLRGPSPVHLLWERGLRDGLGEGMDQEIKPHWLTHLNDIELALVPAKKEYERWYRMDKWVGIVMVVAAIVNGVLVGTKVTPHGIWLVGVLAVAFLYTNRRRNRAFAARMALFESLFSDELEKALGVHRDGLEPSTIDTK